MKVKVQVTIDVDAEAWAEEYGIDKADVRTDVKRWALDRLHRYDDGIARVIPPGSEVGE